MEYDADVVGAGPNGLAAAITLQREGLSVLLLEATQTVGGGTRTAELTVPGFYHDVCSAIHPLAAASPFFTTLPLAEHGLEFIYPPASAAHPFDDGTAAILTRSLSDTAQQCGEDASAYRELVDPMVRDWPEIAEHVLGPLRLLRHPWKMMRFGWQARRSAQSTSKRFRTEKAKGFWAGMAAHSIMPLTHTATAAIGLVLLATGHLRGWPIPRGGSQQVANALASYFLSLGGKLETGVRVTSLDQLPSARVVLFDITPKQLLEIAGHKFTATYNWQLRRYKYGPGVFKIDWALDGPIPFRAQECERAGTVHIGGS